MSMLILCLIVVQYLSTGLSIDLLDPPQTIRGTVWQDWNGNGIRESYEPGLSHATVTLLYQPSGETNFLLNNQASNVIDPVYFFTHSDGQYYFSCLTAGNYSIQITFEESRPSTFSPPDVGSDDTLDSDITQISGKIGTTAFFEATAGHLMTVDAGAVQYAFMSLFPMTGRENVPTEPDTTLGTTYSLYDARTKTLYYRVARGPWKQYNFEDKAGFYEGFPGYNGDLMRPLADRSSVKSNFWMISSDRVINDLYAGKLNVLIHANGSFSDDGRLRGNWTPLINSQYLKTTVALTGQNIVPTPVLSSATGSLQITYNLHADFFEYQLSLSEFGKAKVQRVSLYGPAAANSVGTYLQIDLTEGHHKANISSVPNFNTTFLSNKLYVQVITDQYPNGHVRGQIDGFSQVVYSTSSYFSAYGTAASQVKIALSLDTAKHTLTYYFTVSSSDPTLTTEFDFYLPGSFEPKVVMATDYKAGLFVAQGFFWNLTPDQEQSILTSSDLFILALQYSSSSFPLFDALYPQNWY